MVGSRSRQRREPFVGQHGQLTALVRRAVTPLDPAAFLEPSDRVGQPTTRRTGFTERLYSRMARSNSRMAASGFTTAPPIKQPAWPRRALTNCWLRSISGWPMTTTGTVRSPAEAVLDAPSLSMLPFGVYLVFFNSWTSG
jgi:hypothetical protein